MQHFDDSDLRDPSPPVPGDKERAAVAARAQQLGRKRRMMQGAGALGMVAAVAVGVAAPTAGGTSGSGRGGRIEAAPAGTTATEAVVTTTVPAPATTVPAPTADTAPAPTGTEQAPAVEAPAPQATPDTTPVAPAAPSTYTVSGTVSNIPQGATLTLTLSGSGGTFTAIADSAGNYSMSGVPAGTYDGMYEWSNSSGTATGVGRLGGITITGDSNFSFALQ